MAWDVTSLAAKPGSGGCTTDSAADGWAKCKAVLAFLTAQSKNASTYATSPLWSVVDGPWKLSSFSTTGNVTMVPNPEYSGSPKPKLAAVKFVPYTADSAEYTALKTGPARHRLHPLGGPAAEAGQLGLCRRPTRWAAATTCSRSTFSASPTPSPTSTTRPVGFMVRQLYIRQALQETVDQPGIAKAVWRGYAYPTSGTAPNSPPGNQWIPPPSPRTTAGPYPFNIAKAKSTLESHGWSEVGGVMTCQDPAKCGTGVAKGHS